MRTRRAFLSGLAATAFAADPLKRNMIVRSARPEDFEMPLDGFGSWITPTDRFFVRTHLYTPKVDAGTWSLKVGGAVSKPVTLTLADIKKLPKVELVSVLECAGNGRSFYKPGIIGMQWEHGGVGNGRWAGARLGDVLRLAGLKPSAKEILLNGADVPLGTMPDFQRTVPVRKAVAPETLLAYEMNGEPLPVLHGFPLRAVVPGWAGDSWTKWVTEVTALEGEFDGFFMKTAYRYPVRPVAPGAAVDPKDMAPVESLRVKSVIASPLDGTRIESGAVKVAGVAWSGDAPIARVDVSADGGRTWKQAALGRDQSRWGWRMFEYSWTPAGPGSYAVLARAMDTAGNVQPIAADWNPSGYLWNVVQQARVEVGPGPQAVAAAKPVIPEFPRKVKQACIGCHESDIVAGQKLTRAQWDREITKMTNWGAKVPAGDREEILEWLAKTFPAR